ncbi:NADP-dependent oxidoreductase domain-containing protein [Aspergillus cavernicola]|uniref:NADP-dependent oxidoreductase domain-containing protein n=1 Tax=Aspergillus cavernicola TaxID=176166 RepID=A0ABR4I333_9EURO
MSFTLNLPPQTLLARHRQLAPSAGVRVSPLCLGAMTFGTAQSERYGQMNKEDALGILDTFYSQGGNFIDTANAYREGQSEEWLGEWMAARGNRDEIVLATKYTTPWQRQHAGKLQSNYGGNNMKSLKVTVDSSLARLRTTYIDLYYVHWWDYTTGIPELMHGLNDLVTAGKVLYLGISDTPAWVVSKANEYARQNGLRQFVVYQGMWNATMRDFERDIIPMCRDEGMGLCPYAVLNQGRFQTEEGFREKEKHNEGRNAIPTSQRDKDVSRVLEGIAKKKGVDLLHVALGYVMDKAPYVFPIVGARKVSHIEGSIAGIGVSLTEEEIQEIESVYEFDFGFPHSFLSGTLFDQSKSRGADQPGDCWMINQLGKFDWVEKPKAIRPKKDE